MRRTNKGKQLFGVRRLDELGFQMQRRRLREMAVAEVTAGAGDKMGNPGLLLGMREMDVLLSAYLLRYTLLGLLDTFFLRWVAHPQFTESVHQLIIRRVKLQCSEPGLAGI
jgi:hypothetical protein